MLRSATALRGLALLALLTALAALATGLAPAASAHPLGNFTINYYSGIVAHSHVIDVELVVDRAEIPTLQSFPDATIGRQPAGATAWRAAQCTRLAGEAQLVIDGTPQTLTVRTSSLRLLPGAAGLATSRLVCLTSTAALPRTIGAHLTYRAASTDGHVGWHEITAQGDGVAVADSSVPAQSVSKQLTAYPIDLLASPLNQRSASLDLRAGTGQASTLSLPSPGLSPLYGLDAMTGRYTNLVSKASLTPGFALLALMLSVLLGGLHAFAPGHGKTLMAAYLVGRQGTWRQAAVIGVSVTVTHTIGVLLLGVALSVAALTAPEVVYPWLGLISGLLLAGIGVSLLRTARTGHVHGPGGHTHGPPAPAVAPQPAYAGSITAPADGAGALAPHGHDHQHHQHDQDDKHEYSHADGHGHDHHGAGHHHHEHGDSHPENPVGPRLATTGRLAAVGFVGGMVPSPSALLVLLGGIALGRAWFGAVLVVAYGVGMATALVGTGLLLVAVRGRVERWFDRGDAALTPDNRAATRRRNLLRWTRRLPLATAATVIAVGGWIALRSLLAI